MHFEGTLTIDAPRDKVWFLLTDTELVSRCVPGLESLEVVTPNQRFRVVASVGFGTVRARFVNDMEWLGLDPPNRAGMKLHGTAAGSVVDVTSEMVLADGPDGTTSLRWSADVAVAGALASLAARLMGGVAQRLTGAYFKCVKKRIEEQGGPAQGEPG
jgi:carbon monoxide dehydrogenase subunit G